MRRRAAASPGTDETAVVSLRRGLELLRAFRSHDAPLGNKELVDRTGLPKATVARLTHTLVRTGHLRQADAYGTYQLGDKVTDLGAAFLAGLPVRAIARTHMQDLADRYDMSVALGVPERLSMAYLEYCSGLQTVTMRLRVGTVVPMALTAMGRAYLWALPEDRRERQIEALAAAAGDGRPDLVRRLRASQAELDATGFAVSFGDWRRQVHAVGVPVWLDEGRVLLGLNCGASRHGLSETLFRDEIGPALISVSADISNAMSATGATFWNE